MAKDKEKQAKLEPDEDEAAKEQPEEEQEESKEESEIEDAGEETEHVKEQPEEVEETEDAKEEETHPEDSAEPQKDDFAIQINKQTVARTFAVILAIGLGILIAIAINNQQQSMASQEPFAVVDGVELTMEDVQAFKANLPREVPDQIAQENLILQEILLKEAESLNVTVSTEEAEAQLEESLQLAGMNISEFQEQQGEAYRETLELVRKQAIQNEVLDILSENVTAEPDTMNVRHILVGTENRSKEEAEDLADDIQSDVEDDPEDFCDLVEEHSSDTASISSCGQYPVTQQSQFVSAFKEAAFELDDGEVTTVESQFGYHVILKDNETVSQQAIIQELIPQLEEKYNVERLNGEEEQQPRIEPENTTEENKTPVEEVEAPEPEEPEPEPEPQEDSEPAVPESNFAECLDEAETTLYTISWSPETEKQLDILGDAVEFVEHVECDASEDLQTQCEQAGITTYPTWVLNGEEYIGLKTETALSNLLSC